MQKIGVNRGDNAMLGLYCRTLNKLCIWLFQIANRSSQGELDTTQACMR
jgi:hypothetical protein